MGVKIRLAQGSVRTFVIVGIILTIVLIGTIYVLKQHGEVVRKEQAIAAYDKQQASKKTAEDSKKSGVVSDNTENPDNTKSDNSVQELPVTGANFNVSQLLGLGLLVTSMIGYVLSRRSLIRSL